MTPTTATITLPATPPVTLALPASALSPAPGAVVVGKRVWCRNVAGAYAEAEHPYFDLAGDATAAVDADAQAQIAKLTADLEEAHGLLSAYVGNVDADAKKIDADANSFVNRIEKFFGFEKTAAPAKSPTAGVSKGSQGGAT